jgi:hypothetical protein
LLNFPAPSEPSSKNPSTLATASPMAFESGDAAGEVRALAASASAAPRSFFVLATFWARASAGSSVQASQTWSMVISSNSVWSWSKAAT